MNCGSVLTNEGITGILNNEIAALGGNVSDYDEGDCLYIRATLPNVDPLWPGDDVQGGIAVRATADDIRVQPYIVRHANSNGLIITHPIETHCLSRSTPSSSMVDKTKITKRLRYAVKSCSSRQNFKRSADQMRSLKDQKIYEQDFDEEFMHFMAKISRVEEISPKADDNIIDRIFIKYYQEKDGTLFGFLDAVTATAQDIDVHLEPLFRCFRRGIPVRDNHAAERISG